MGLDYYTILGVARNCTTEDIILAYQQLAFATHPHRNTYPMHPESPPEGCQDSVTHLPRIPKDICWIYVNEAYDVLVNPLHREVFDRYGEEGLKGGNLGETVVQPYVYHGNYMRTYHDALGISSNFVDLVDADVLFPAVSDRGLGITPQDPPLVLPLLLDLKDVFFGSEQKYTLFRHEFTDHTHMHTELSEHTFTIPTRRGIRSGCTIKFPGEGDRSPFKLPPDVVFVVEDRPDPIFMRDGSDLHWTYEVESEKALSGFNIELNTLDDRRLLIPIADSPSYIKRVEDEGLPTEEDPTIKGNLYIHFKR